MIVCAGNSVDTAQRPLPPNSEIRLSELQLSRRPTHDHTMKNSNVTNFKNNVL